MNFRVWIALNPHRNVLYLHHALYIFNDCLLIEFSHFRSSYSHEISLNLFTLGKKFALILFIFVISFMFLCKGYVTCYTVHSVKLMHLQHFDCTTLRISLCYLADATGRTCYICASKPDQFLRGPLCLMACSRRLGQAARLAKPPSPHTLASHTSFE
jgi:hypothetical protein